MKVQKAAIGEEIKKSYANGMKACPTATMDVSLNLKNRNHAIKEYGYGPLNPEEPSTGFWDKKATMWEVTPSQAKKSLCGNCSAFIVTPQMMECMTKGIQGDEPEGESYAPEVIAFGKLGYCELFDFKCAGSRTCDAWIVGGPVK